MKNILFFAAFAAVASAAAFVPKEILKERDCLLNGCQLLFLEMCYSSNKNSLVRYKSRSKPWKLLLWRLHG